MILPIYTLGQPILRERTDPIEADSPELQQLIDDMIETMHHAEGIGLAAPQVGRSERLFVADFASARDDLREAHGGVLPWWAEAPVAFLNPEIVEADDETACEFEEGCLSIPGLSEYVTRPDRLRIRFLDRDFQAHELDAEDVLSRVFQHELDHLDGVLFVDHLSPLRRRLLRRRLQAMVDGEVEADYPVLPPGLTVPR
ncbi:MAG: peptide deformylase [Rubricoccaceae bacterium]|nr:peptide deformylase [Rubricoccaceae bacterium]